MLVVYSLAQIHIHIIQDDANSYCRYQQVYEFHLNFYIKLMKLNNFKSNRSIFNGSWRRLLSIWLLSIDSRLHFLLRLIDDLILLSSSIESTSIFTDCRLIGDEILFGNGDCWWLLFVGDCWIASDFDKFFYKNIYFSVF